MAQFVGHLTRSSFKLLSTNAFKQLMINGSSRNLYSAASMGLNGYLSAREHVHAQFRNVEQTFFDQMKKYVEADDNSMVFTEDLKTMLHLVEKNPEVMDLLYKMLKKYKTQNNLRFSSFTFGPVVMRAFYHLDEPDLALKIFMDPDLDGFWDQIVTHQLLMDLLYNHGRYDDVREVYKVTMSKTIHGLVHPRNPFIIVMAAYYQQNTKESFEYASKLFKEARGRGYEFPRRSISYMAALALKQNEPSIALEVASLARNVRYIDIRCIKVIAFARLKRLDEIMVHLRESLQSDATGRKQTYFTDAIEEIEKYIKSENFDEHSDIVKMLNQIKMHDYVQTGTLHDHITSIIDSVKAVNKPWKSGQPYQENLQSNPAKERFRYSQRPGIRDSVV